MAIRPIEDAKRYERFRPKNIIKTPWVWVALVFTIKCAVDEGADSLVRCGLDPVSEQVASDEAPRPRAGAAMPHYERLEPAPAPAVLSGVDGHVAGHPYRVLLATQDPTKLQQLERVVREQAARVEASFDPGDPESALARLNASDTPVEVQRNFVDALELAKHVHEASQGAFAPLVVAGKAQPFAALDWTRDESGAYRLTKRAKGLEVRLGELLTGLAADQFCTALEEAYASDYIVEVDGSACAGGNSIEGRPWTFTVGDGFFAQPGGSLTRTFTLAPDLLPMGIATAKGPWTEGERDLVRVTVLAASAAEAQAWALGLATLDQVRAFQLASQAQVAAYAIAWQGGRFLDRDTPAMAQRLRPASQP